MTTNQERAHALISSAIDTLALEPTAPWFERELPKIAQALADAGLLMPDLPEHDEDEWENFGNVISLDGMYILPMIENDALTPGEARDIAYSLLAAANHAEQRKPQ